MNQPAHCEFRPLVVDDGTTSLRETANVTALYDAYRPDRRPIEIVDAFRDAARALASRVFMTPILIKAGSLTVRRIVGTWSQRQVVLPTLDLAGIAA